MANTTLCFDGLPEKMSFPSSSHTKLSTGMHLIVALVASLIACSVSAVPSQWQRRNFPVPIFRWNSSQSSHFSTFEALKSKAFL